MSVPVVQVGLDRRSASVELLGDVHREIEARRSYRVEEGTRLVPLVTCHRVELYLECVAPQAGVEAFLDWLGFPAHRRPGLLQLISVRTGGEAARHLLRVASGLDSAVLGEDQVLGQVREAYRSACASRTPGPLLHGLFHAALRAGKRVRNETSLGEGGRSLAGSGVGVLGRVLGGLRARSVLVLGAGEMGSLAARRLRERGVGRLLVTNRTWDKGASLARDVRAEALPWDWRRRVLGEVDGLVCATGSRDTVLRASWFDEAVSAGGRLRCVVDLSVPPNVEVPLPTPEGMVFVNVDAIGRHLADDQRRRREAVVAAGSIVEEEVEKWLARVERHEEWRVRQAVSIREDVAG